MVAAIYFFRGYMEQRSFGSNYLLRSATFLEDLKGSLFKPFNIIHPSVEVVHLFFVIERMTIIYSLKCTVLFSFVTACCPSLPLIVIYCHSLSFNVTRCHSAYHWLLFVAPLVVIRCHSLQHSLSFVVTCCHSMYHSSVFLWTIIYKVE